MAWRRPGDKPLSEAMMVNLPTYICVTRPQWVKGRPIHHHWILDFQYWIHTINKKITHWGQVTKIRFCKLTTIASDSGLSPGRRQAIIRTSAGILLIEHLGTNFSDILVGIHTFSFKIMPPKMSSAKWFSLYLSRNVLIGPPSASHTCMYKSITLSNVGVSDVCFIAHILCGYV